MPNLQGDRMKPTHRPEESRLVSELLASGFDLEALREKINLSVAKAKARLLTKEEQEKLANRSIGDFENQIEC